MYLCIRYAGFVQDFFLNALGAGAPLVIGGAIAYIINILMSFYERHFFPNTKNRFVVGVRRPLCMFSAVVSLAAIIAVVISLILPQLVSCIKLIIAEIPVALNELIKYLEKTDFAPKTLINELSKFDLNESTANLVGVISGYFGNVVNALIEVVTRVFSGVVSALLSVIFAFYLLIAKDKLTRQANKLVDCYLKPKAQKKTRYIVRVLNESFHKYIVGQCTEAVILGVLCTIGMLILGLPHATMIGALSAFTALIPIVGAYVGALVGAFIIAMTSSPIEALVFLLFIILLQQFEGNLIYPKVVGTSLGLPAIWVLAAVTIGGGVLGIPGMLIGVPLAAAIYRIVRHDVRKRISAVENKEHDSNTLADSEKEV